MDYIVPGCITLPGSFSVLSTDELPSLDIDYSNQGMSKYIWRSISLFEVIRYSLSEQYTRWKFSGIDHGYGQHLLWMYYGI